MNERISIVSRRQTALLIALAVMAGGAAPWTYAANDVAGELITFNDNGAWSWFEDERAIVDTAAGKIIVSSVAAAAGAGGASRSGDVDVAAYDLATGAVTQFVLNENLQVDDHNSAALWRRPDGRYLAMYSRHGSDAFTRWRISTHSGDISSWGPEQTFNNGAGTTYSNLHYLPNDNGGAGRLYNFTRTIGFDPNILVSSDLGDTWSYGGRLLQEGDASDRPYLRYFSDGEKVHLIATEQHPRDFDNSIYHAYVQDGVLYSSTGSRVDGNLFDAGAAEPEDLTPIFTTGTSVGGAVMRHGWTLDVAIDDAGLPYAVFQMRADNSSLDHRFFYARFDGSVWSVNELAKAGGYLYASENDYTGLAALDPHDPNRLFISTKIDPRTQVTMPRYEIFEGVTTNGGADWTWAPITYNSTADNLRPIVPRWDDEHTALLWMRGNYSTYTNYDLAIVGLTEITPLVETSVADLNGDGAVDVGDFTLYFTGLHADLDGLTPEEAYMLGDMNGDFANNYEDFVIFREAYDAALGAGSFVATFQVPEGAAMEAFVSGVGGLLFVRGLGMSSPARASGIQP
ncbi:MAG TPA: BNR-4 repeat-containing protein [Lacipirellula sp.]